MIDEDVRMAREADRQKLIEDLVRSLFGLEDTIVTEPTKKGVAHAVFLSAGISLLSEIDSRQGVILDGAQRQEIKNFIETCCREIKKFSRAKEEENAILSDLAKRMTEGALHPIHGALSGLEILNPEKVFKNPSAVDVVG